MGAKAIIRQGDKTSHGGTVLEGHPFLVVHGKPAAGVGHKVSCPKCSGTITIVEGVVTSTMMGIKIAVEGMKTSCGATLIPSQFTDTVELGGGAVPASNAARLSSANEAEEELSATKANRLSAATNPAATKEEGTYDLFFHVKHEKTNQNMSNTPYKITLDDGREFIGLTDENGHTEKVYSNSAQTAKIEVPYHDDSATHSASKSDACGC